MSQGEWNIGVSSVRTSIFRRALNALRDIAPIWLVLAGLTTLPYVIAVTRTPNGADFSGVMTAYDDTFSYLVWMKQSARGGWLMCDLYTSETHACEFFLPLWLLLGKIARVTGAPIVCVFHAARLFSSLLLLFAARSVARLAMRSRRRVLFTLWLYALSGGVGWVVYLLSNRGGLLNGTTTGSADLNLPEAIAFRSAYSQVHFTLGAALLAWAISLAISSLKRQPRAALGAGILTSALAVVHPYLVVVVCAVVIAVLILVPFITPADQPRKSPLDSARCGIWFGLAAIPGVAYLLYLNRSNEVLREWLRVTGTFSPPPLEYVFGLGFVAMLSILGFKLLWKTRPFSGRLLLIWVIVQAVLLYAPVSYQRRFVEGLQLPLCVGASVALFWLAGRLRVGARTRALLLSAFIVVASLTNIGFIIGQVIARGDVTGANDPRRYVPSDLAKALRWLGENGEPQSIILCSYLTGNIAPSISGMRVYLGHYGQTLRSEEKGREVTAFYGGEMRDDAARNFLQEHQIVYVIYGPFERRINESVRPPAGLRLAQTIGAVQIFKVSPEE